MLYIKSNHQNTKEYQFLCDFIKLKFFSKYLNNDNLDYTILEEPFTGLGYTDLVLIIWNKDLIHKWSSERNKLTIDDIRILHHLYLSKIYKTIPKLISELGFHSKFIKKSLSRLEDAGLIKFNKTNKFKALNKSDIFFINNIISIEAKLKDWRRALEQAYVNSFYASESYILFPEKSISNRMLDTYKKTDIGIITYNKEIELIKKAKKMTIPANFNSWLFNEHIGRLYKCQ